MAKIGILGSGSFGCSLGYIMDKAGHDIFIWGYNKSEIDDIKKNRENKKHLPVIKLKESIQFSTDFENLKGCSLVIFAVPSFAVGETIEKCYKYIDDDCIVINVAKGFDPDTNKFLSDILQPYLKQDIVVLSGPSHAEEVARGIPTTMVASSKNESNAKYVQDVLMVENFRIYVNDDIIGTQVGGALKNIIAIACGICEGLGLGDNSKAALMTRGLAEVSRLGRKLGAKLETFSGLTGLGDLIVTCTSVHSRNTRAGIFIGRGFSPKQAMDKVGMVVEGYNATRSAYAYMNEYNVVMPIVKGLYGVLFEGWDVKSQIINLMRRDKTSENENILYSSFQ